jgi:hypothetical protein
MIAGSPFIQRHKPDKAKLANVKTVDKHIDRPNRIVLGYIIFKFGWEKCTLAPINSLLPSADSQNES